MSDRAAYWINIWYRFPGDKALAPECFDRLDDAIEEANEGICGYAYHETIWRKPDGTAEIIDLREPRYTKQRRAG